MYWLGVNPWLPTPAGHPDGVPVIGTSDDGCAEAARAAGRCTGRRAGAPCSTGSGSRPTTPLTRPRSGAGTVTLDSGATKAAPRARNLARCVWNKRCASTAFMVASARSPVGSILASRAPRARRYASTRELVALLAPKRPASVWTDSYCPYSGEPGVETARANAASPASSAFSGKTSPSRWPAGTAPTRAAPATGPAPRAGGAASAATPAAHAASAVASLILRRISPDPLASTMARGDFRRANRSGQRRREHPVALVGGLSAVDRLHRIVPVGGLCRLGGLGRFDRVGRLGVLGRLRWVVRLGAVGAREVIGDVPRHERRDPGRGASRPDRARALRTSP